MATIYTNAQGQQVYDSNGATYSAKTGQLVSGTQNAPNPFAPTNPSIAYGAVNTNTPSPYFSSEQGLTYVDQAKTKIGALAPLQQTPEQKAQALKDAANPPKQPEPTKPSGGYSLDDVLALTKDMTGWKQQADGTYLPDETALKNLGVTTGGASVEEKQAEEQLTAAKAQRDAAYTKLTSFDVSNNPELQSTIKVVTGSWDARIREMEVANKNRMAQFTASGLRTFTPQGGVGQTFADIISNEEFAAINRITDLESQKQAALLDAKNAYSSQQWNRYYQLANLADKTYQEQLEEVKALGKARVEQDKKIQDANKLQSLNDTIYNSVVSLKGGASPMAIYEDLRNKGVDVTMADVDKFWDAVKPKDSPSGLFKFSSANLGKMLARWQDPNLIQSVQDDLNDGGPTAVLDGLPEAEREWFWSLIANEKTGGIGGNLTWSEVRTMFGNSPEYAEVVLNFVNKPEWQVLEILQNPTPPTWFLKFLKSQGVDILDAEMDYLPEAVSKQRSLIANKWDTFRLSSVKNLSNSLASVFSDLGNETAATTDEDGI